MTYELPTELVRMANEGRLIPFAGAGLSASVGLPAWRSMLDVASDILDTGPTFAEIEKSCSGNLLQIAEYLFIASGGHIGPLRQKLAECLITSGIDITQSGCHVELFNIGAPQIYTTNYDDLIEKTYRVLGEGCDVVALPRHLALGGASSKPQVVKYHGDLRYEQTLVLTESSYYERMDFESPMDLKFRSDLLGRSVLFVGYSFSDINIRMIWHRLMQMMKDVPERDRPISWIIRFDDDPIQEALNLAAGIRTIVLTEIPGIINGGTPTQRLAAFLIDLSLSVAQHGFNAVASRRQFVSSSLLEEIDRAFDAKSLRLGRAPLPATALRNVDALGRRTIPETLADSVSATFLRLSAVVWTAAPGQIVAVLRAVFNAVFQGFLAPGQSGVIMRSLMRGPSRTALFEVVDQSLAESGRTIPWRQLFGQTQAASFAVFLMRALQAELATHERYSGDVDLLYIYDLAVRVRRGLLPVTDLDGDALQELDTLIERAANLYGGLLGTYDVDADAPPPKSMADALEENLPEEPDLDWEIIDDDMVP